MKSTPIEHATAIWIQEKIRELIVRQGLKAREVLQPRFSELLESLGVFVGLSREAAAQPAFTDPKEIALMALGISHILAEAGVVADRPEDLRKFAETAAEMAVELGYQDVRNRECVWLAWIELQRERNWQLKDTFSGLWNAIQHFKERAGKKEVAVI